jgi:hypothetical protein
MAKNKQIVEQKLTKIINMEQMKDANESPKDYKRKTIPWSKNFTSTDHLLATRDIRHKYGDLLEKTNAKRRWPNSISDIFPED